MTDPFARFTPSFEAVAAFHQANFEAVVQAQTVFFQGFQKIAQEMAAQAQSHFQDATAVSTAALGAKTVQEAVERNVENAKAGYDKLVAGSTKLGELGVQVANDALAPIKARATAAAEILMKPVAA